MTATQPQLQELLVRAGALADAGQWAEARSIFREICELQPDNDEAWFMDGSLSMELGETEHAITSLDRALAINATHSSALFLKASLVLSQGETGAAIDLCLRCVGVDPDHAEAWTLLGRLQGATGKYAEALASSERAIKLDPALTGAQLTKAHMLQSLGRLPEAVEAYRAVTAISPDRLDIFCATGRLLIQLNRWEDAEDSFSAALRLNPKSAMAHEGLGTVYATIGRLDPAEHHLRQALQYGPALHNARRLLGTVLRNKGDLQGALEHWEIVAASAPGDQSLQTNLCLLHWELGEVTRALAACLDLLEKNPANLALRQILPGMLTDLPGRQDLLVRVRAEITGSFGVSGIDCETLFSPGLRLLQQDPELSSIFDSLKTGDTARIEDGILSGRFSPLLDDELFLLILCNATVCDVGLEKRLTGIRTACLNISGRDDISLESLPSPGYSFLASLACQCFHTEYSYAITPDEKEKLERLEQVISSCLRSTEALESSAIFHLIIYAMYRPLHGLEGIDHHGQHLCSPGVKQLDLLVKRQVEDYSRELEARNNIPGLTRIQSRLSREIEVEYDDSPYPRWLSAGVYSPEPYRMLFRRRYPTFEDPGVDPQPLRILVAGCGTGRHAILAASRFDSAEVLAIDLSLPSLAYGQRMAEELGVDNISFQQADIMELDSTLQKFHVIEAGGVLHNMESPPGTIKLFSDLLEEKGLLYVSTYRKAARNMVLMAREIIRGKARPKTPDGIRQARQDIIALADTRHSLRGMITSRDFFTLNEARFLLFDVHEHTFEMDELYTMLEENGLRMIGFDLETPRDLNRYRLLNPDDPSVANQTSVRAFEIEHPSAFAGKYQFWCQKLQAQ